MAFLDNNTPPVVQLLQRVDFVSMLHRNEVSGTHYYSLLIFVSASSDHLSVEWCPAYGAPDSTRRATHRSLSEQSWFCRIYQCICRSNTAVTNRLATNDGVRRWCWPDCICRSYTTQDDIIRSASAVSTGICHWWCATPDPISTQWTIGCNPKCKFIRCFSRKFA